MSGTTHTRTSISNINTMICRMYSSGTSTIHLPSCPFKSYMIQLDGSWNFSIYSWPKVIPVIEQFSLDSLGAVVVEMYLSFQLAVAVAWHVFLWWWKKFISDVCHQWFETWQPTLNSQQFKVRVSAFPTIYSLFFCRFSTRFFLRCVTLTSTLSGSSPQSHDAFALSRLPGFPDTGCPDRTLFCGWVGRVAWIQNTNRKSSLANLASLVDQYGNRFIYHSYIIICYDLMNLKWWRDSLQSVDMHSHTHTHTFGTIPLRSRLIGIILWWTNIWMHANVYPCVSIEYVLYTPDVWWCLHPLSSTVLNYFVFYCRRPVAESPSITSWQRHVSHWKTMVIQEWYELTANMSHPTDQSMFIRSIIQRHHMNCLCRRKILVAISSRHTGTNQLLQPT